MNGKVGIVLVSYNDQEYILPCLNSIFGQTYTNYHIYIVNNSPKDLKMELKRDVPISIIQSATNLGWGGGSNVGINRAIEEGAEYILLLNIDTELKKNTLEILMQYVKEDTAVAPFIYRTEEGGKSIPWYAGGRIDFEKGDVEQRLYTGEKFRENTYEVGFMTGCCILISTKGVKKTGLISEEYFLYFEDADYCMRLKQNGIKMLYVQGAELWHKVGGSSGAEVSYVSQYYTVRNKLYFCEKFKQYMHSDTIDVLKNILEGRAYFESPDTIKYRQFVMAGIKDFLQGKMGKENHLIEGDAYFIQGFLEKERDTFNTWRWVEDQKAMIEIFNTSEKAKDMQVSFFLAPPPGKAKRRIYIRVGKIKVEDVVAPKEVILNLKFDAKESKRICLSTREKVVKLGSNDPRQLAFQVRNFSIDYLD